MVDPDPAFQQREQVRDLWQLAIVCGELIDSVVEDVRFPTNLSGDGTDAMFVVLLSFDLSWKSIQDGI